MPKPLKILQASAGSGKTFSLAAHYLTLLFSGPNKYREILAVTFTNKATEEMKSRILEVLKAFAKGEEKAEAYRKIILSAHPDLTPITLKIKADEIYRKILHDYSRFSVSTIDGFVQKVIRSFAFELGLDAEYVLEMNYDKVKQDLAEKLNKALDKNEVLLRWIIDLAKDRISNSQSWNYRKELLELTSEIFKERYQPFEEALRSFDDKGINELFTSYNSATKKLIGDFGEKLQAQAQNALNIFTHGCPDQDCLKGKSKSPLLSLQRITIGDLKSIPKLEKLIDTPGEWLQKGVESDLFALLNPSLKTLVETYYSELPDYTLAKAFNKNLYYLRLMQEMASLLREYRVENSNLLISDAQNLLKGLTDDAGDNPSFIWEKMGNRYTNYLFDEFQDTSANQWSSFLPLLSNAIAAPGEILTDHLIVGDAKQSIYRWRNGDWNILHKKAREDVGAYNVLEHSLEENYRSTKNIIDFNNRIYQAIPDIMQNELNSTVNAQGDENLSAWWGEKSFNTIIKAIYSKSRQNYPAGVTEGGTVEVKILQKDEDGFKEQALTHLLAEVDKLILDWHYGLKDICVLVRTNAEAISVVETLMLRGVDVISGEALMLSNSDAVKLLLNTLQVMAGMPLNTALYKANCISLYAKLRKETASTDSYFGLKFKSLSQLEGLLPADLCKNWAGWIQQPLPGLIEKIIEAYGLNSPQQKIHLPYLLAFQDLTGKFTSQGERGISSFLAYWDEEGAGKTLPSADHTDAVQVVTIHKSKGLAFRAVLVPFCNWEIKGRSNSIFWVSSENTPYHHLQSIPLKYSSELAASSVSHIYLEELLYNNLDALNMLYVATTRAIDHIYISVAGKKTATLSNIGDLLGAVLKEDLSAEGSWIVDEHAISREKKPEEKNYIEMETYPISNRLGQVFESGLRSYDFESLISDDAGRTGSILHDMLSRISENKDLEEAAAEMQGEGIFKVEEAATLQARARKVMDNESLSALFQPGQEELVEQDIIDVNGRSYRPDKLLIREKEVTIIDYKFTLQESDTHIEQVDNYRRLLLEMGYEKVAAYLFYAETEQLKKIA